MSGGENTGETAQIQALAIELIAEIGGMRDELAAEGARQRAADRERIDALEAARRGGEHGRDWQILQQRIDLRETTESDILYGLDHSTQARAVREVAGRHLAQVRDAYRRVLGDPGEQLTAQLAEFTTARDALSAQLEHLARLEGDN